MGGSFSVPDGFAHSCLVPMKPNKLLLIHGDSDMKETVEKSIKTIWPEGLKRQGGQSVTRTYELTGQAFTREVNKANCLALQKLCCAILDSFLQKGWQLILSSDLSLETEHTTWFFKKIAKNELSKDTLLCLTMAEINKLQLMNVPEVIRNLIQETIGNCKEDKVGDEYELTLPAQPWVSTGFEANCRATHMVLNVLRAMNTEGYRIYGTANLRDENDSLFFQKDPNPVTGTKLSLMALNRSGEIRFFGLEPESVKELLGVATAYWPPGASFGRINKPFECEELRISGDPWEENDEHPYGAHWLLAMMLQKLRALGWKLERCMSLSSNAESKSVFLLSSCDPADLAHAVLAPHIKKGLALVGGPKAIADALLIRAKKVFSDDSISLETSDMPAPKERKKTITGHEEWHLPEECQIHELKMKKNVWETQEQKVEIATRHLMCVLLHEFEANGWTALASADISGDCQNFEESYDLDSWFIVPK